MIFILVLQVIDILDLEDHAGGRQAVCAVQTLYKINYQIFIFFPGKDEHGGCCVGVRVAEVANSIEATVLTGFYWRRFRLSIS